MAALPATLRFVTISGVKSCPAAVYIVQKRNASADAAPVTTKLTSLKRGTGGRSSFSGVVATVFGASGFLGPHVINKLGKVGTQVIIPYRGDHYLLLKLKLCGDLGQIMYLPYNLKDEESLRKAMKYSNVVINLIGKDNETRNFTFEDVHVTGARTIARIAKESGVQRLIHVSALNACENPEPVVIKGGSNFLKSKWRGEQAVREEFPEAIIFRPSDIYGQNDRFLFYYGCPWRRQLTFLPVWNQGRNIFKQPIYANDLAAGIVNSIFEKSAEGKTFQAVGPHRYELKEMLEWFLRVMRKTKSLGYRITDMKYDPLFMLKVDFSSRLFVKSPKLSWEKIERDHVTDVLTPGLPTLDDLGIQLTELEERVACDMDMFRTEAYSEDLGNYDRPEPAPRV